MKKALITGITGQDGSYLAEFLLSKGYEVHGLVRRSSTPNLSRIEKLTGKESNSSEIFLHYGDLSDTSSLSSVIRAIMPDEVYNLGAQSHVRVSFDVPEYTGDIVGIGVTRLLESLRIACCNARFYQASSSELYGSTPPPHNEKTPFHPRSPYAAAKLYGYCMTVNYRESYDMFACNGILFNHESPRRGENFVTRKITRALARILRGDLKKIALGNLDARRDWGFAPDYIECIWRILNHEKPEDFVIGSGESHSIREFLEEAFSYVGLDWKKYVEIDPKFFRPAEVDHLLADASKAQRVLGWRPKVTFKELVWIMVDADCQSFGDDAPGKGIVALKAKGFEWTSCDFRRDA